MHEKLIELYKPLPPEAVQKTDGSKTRKGYDTTGYGYQYEVDRMNELFGDKWGYTWNIIHNEAGTNSSGKRTWEVTVNVGVWLEEPTNARYHAGGHISKIHGDAVKGAITDGIKKTFAMWGLGSDAYRGEIDDNNMPIPSVIDPYSQVPNADFGETSLPPGNLEKFKDFVPTVKDMAGALELEAMIKSKSWSAADRKVVDDMLDNLIKELSPFKDGE